MLYSAGKATFFVFFLLTFAVLLLIGAFITNEFGLIYVAGYSSRSLPLFFKVTGLWAGLDGSILFWTWLVSLYSVIVWSTQKNRNPDWLPTLNGVMSFIILFFVSIMVFANNPFAPSLHTPPDGKGLNPLLQNIAMVFHPPSLYLGFTGFSVPFSFALAALRTRRLDSAWIDATRRWVIVAWFFLTLGLILGGAWAYVELGWGGFWAWDPVENAALMPWLLATAYLHSVIIQKKRGMLMTWNVTLICLTFLLTIFGTYLTRSGIVQSVHAFSEGNLGPFFLGFMQLIIVVSAYFIITRLNDLKSRNRLVSQFSKENAFILNNILFVFATFTVIWGTLFPTVSEWLTGHRTTVGIPFFNKIMAPIGLLLLALMGIGPMISWKKSSWINFKRNLLLPLVLGFFGCIAFWILGIRQWYALGSFALVLFVLTTVYLEFYRGIHALRLQNKTDAWTAFKQLFVTSNRRYGGYVVHLGVLLIFIGIAGCVFKQEVDFALKPGEVYNFAGHSFRYVEPLINEDEHRTSVAVRIEILKGEKILATLIPARNFYKQSEQPSTEASIYHTLLQDIYVIVGNMDTTTSRADLRVTFNPLISYVWVGGFVILLGVVLLLMPSQKGGLKSTSTLASILFMLFLWGYPLSPVYAQGMHVETGEDPFIFLDKDSPRYHQIKEISGKIICQCGGCVRMDLASCTCSFAKGEHNKIMSMLDQGMNEEGILDAFVKKYGMPVLTEPPNRGAFRLGAALPLVMLPIVFILGIILIAKKRRKQDEVLVSGESVPANYLKKFSQEVTKNHES